MRVGRGLTVLAAGQDLERDAVCSRWHSFYSNKVDVTLPCSTRYYCAAVYIEHNSRQPLPRYSMRVVVGISIHEQCRQIQV